MAMKFWFGKKEAEPEAPREATSDVLTISERAGEVVSPEPLFVGRQEPSVAVRDEAPPAVAPAAGPDDGKAPVAVREEAAPAPVPAAVAQTPTETKKVVLKPVGGAVRLTPRAAEGAPAATVGNSPFVLRPKAEAAVPGAPFVPAAPAEGKGVVERGSGDSLIRPKPEQRALYYQLMNGLYDAVLVLDSHGHVVDCSSRVTEMLGYSREEAWDLPIEKVIAGMSAQMFEHLRRSLAENHHVLIDARCSRQDGTSFAGEVGVSTLSLTREANMVFAIRNVERRKCAMDDLRRSRAALDIALSPAFVCDTDGFFVVVNQAFLDAFGIPGEEQAKAVRLMDLLPDVSRHFLRASCGEQVNETLKVAAANGLPVTFQMALMPVQSGQNVTSVAGSILQV